MSTINIFQISFEIWGCIISIIVCLLLGTDSYKSTDAVKKKLWRMILINNFLLISDALAYIYRGDMTPIGIAMTRISNFSMFALEYLILLMFVDYVKSITELDASKSIEWWEYPAFALQTAGFIGLVITQFTGFYYLFDDTNHYQRGNGLWLSFAVCGAVILICIIRLWLCRKRLGKNVKSTFILSIIIFVICIVVQFLFYGLSLINTAITIVLLLMYLRHSKLQYELYINSSIDEAIKDTEALSEWKYVSDCAAKQPRERQYEKNKD